MAEKKGGKIIRNAVLCVSMWVTLKMITTRLMYGLVGAVGCFLFIAAKVLVPHWSVFSVLGSKARATLFNGSSDTSIGLW